MLRRWLAVAATHRGAVTAILVFVVAFAVAATTTQIASSATSGPVSRVSIPHECFGARTALPGSDCPASHKLGDRSYLLVNSGNQRPGISNGSVCQQPRGATTVKSCSFGAVDGTQVANVALVGDSHAGMWAPALNVIAVQSRMRVTTYLEAACAVTADGGVVYGPDRTTAAGCRAWRDRVIAAVAADPKIDVVVTSSNNRNYVTESTGAIDPGNGYLTAWKEWLAAGKRVVVINDVPQHKSFVTDCIARSNNLTDPCAIPVTPFLHPGPLGVAAAKIHDPKFSYLDFQDIMCDKVCHSVIGGIPAYVDSDHLSAAFARSFAPGLLNAEDILGHG